MYRKHLQHIVPGRKRQPGTYLKSRQHVLRQTFPSECDTSPSGRCFHRHSRSRSTRKVHCPSPPYLQPTLPRLPMHGQGAHTYLATPWEPVLPSGGSDCRHRRSLPDSQSLHRLQSSYPRGTV
ncbi:hypothetical protein EVA_15109 [gut metagenome]|uniref:Uncharacterized protein n=1 Tax=gut metagenome TaxID=749906 RepID=J9GBI9_9ZZZZ